MKTKLEKLKLQLIDTLMEYRRIDNQLERVTKSSMAVENTILAINGLLEEHQFDSQQEEIDFFKTFKPEILALKLEEVLLYHIAVNKPIGTPEAQLAYFEDEFHALQTFLRMNAYHYQYYKNNLKELDSLFFLRNAGPLTVPLAEISDIDAEYSTPMTFLFARFIAYERIQYHILEEITSIKYPVNAHPWKNTTDDMELKWTGGVINIVELIYGLFLTGQFNNGNASLNQIVRWMEAHLDVNIGIIQRKLSEIERRKRLSVTKFIDQMKDAINDKIENGQG